MKQLMRCKSNAICAAGQKINSGSHADKMRFIYVVIKPKNPDPKKQFFTSRLMGIRIESLLLAIASRKSKKIRNLVKISISHKTLKGKLFFFYVV